MFYVQKKGEMDRELEVRVKTAEASGSISQTPALESATQLGRCRRHSPVVGQGWPAVFSEDWCGDHKLDENKR
jgi:hypothetical protein